MENDYDFDCVEIPSYEEFKETLTRALKSNPLNWSQKRKYESHTTHAATKARAQSVESNTASTISSQDSGSYPDSSPAGNLNLQTSQIFQRRQIKKFVQEESGMCK